MMIEKDKHDNAGQLLVEILRVSRDALLAPTDDKFDNSLLLTAESKETSEVSVKIEMACVLKHI